MSDPGQSGVESLLASLPRWHLWIDTGGTFTDCLALAPDGDIQRAKVLSSGRIRGVVAQSPDPATIDVDAEWDLPDGFFRGAGLRLLDDARVVTTIEGYRSADRSLRVAPLGGATWQAATPFEILSDVEAPILAAHWVTRIPLAEKLPPITMRLATTRGTNALLERSGSPTALFVTRGFADLLEIGTQQRPDLFALAVEKRSPLYEEVVEVDERLDRAGRTLVPLDVEALRPRAIQLLEKGVEVAAVALMHSYREPRHEDDLARMLTEIGFEHVSRSAALAPLIKIVPRAETAVVNAYLSQVIGSYLSAVGGLVDPGPLHVLTSAGSLVRAEDYLPKDSLLSGPAGGVVGAAAVANESGSPRSLAFDMGGTSTDVSRFDEEFDYRFETEVGDARLLTPSLAIETVAAGGGSICSFDGRQLKVGPESAGADPGPACYGAGGPLTLTDVNLLLGRLDPDSFEIPIQVAAAAEAARDLTLAVAAQRDDETSTDRLLEGLLAIANERMAEAVRRISIRQGYRPSDYALVAFGGAGGQHACALAEILGVVEILVPVDAGLLSAVGLGRARIERMAERQILRRLDEVQGSLPDIMRAMVARAESAVLDEGIAAGEVEVRRRLIHLRLLGQESSLAVDYAAGANLQSDFCRLYEDHFGYRPQDPVIEVESVRVLAGSRDEPREPAVEVLESGLADPTGRHRALLGGQWQEVPVYDRQELSAGHRLQGPALVFESHCATVVDRGWEGSIDAHRCLVLQRQGRDG